MGLEQAPPASIAQLGRPLGRCDDVGEEDGGQDSVGLMGMPGAGQELLDFIQEIVRVADIDKMIFPRQLDKAGTRDLCGHEAAAVDGDQPIIAPMQDQGRHRDGRQGGGDVDLSDSHGQAARHRRAGRGALEEAPCLSHRPVASETGRENVN